MLDAALVREVFEARRLLLAEASALAAARRTGSRRRCSSGWPASSARGGDDATAQGLDLAFMATVIEAARNLAFSLIANSIRDVYLERLDLFRAIVERPDELGYAAVAAAIADGDGAARARR